MKIQIQVWDLPIRLFHWSLVASVFYSWFSVDVLENMEHHFYAGYTVITLLLFRLVWGFIGSSYARFRSFIFTPKEIIEYAKHLFSTSTPNETAYTHGHNPLGSVSVIAMLLVLLTQAGLGLFSSDDYYFGPLSGLVDTSTMGWLSQLHSLNSNVVFGIISLHITAIAYYKFRKNQGLTKTMITGRRSLLGSGVHEQTMRPGQNLIAVIVLIMCILTVYWLATAFLDRLPTSSESYY
jgi:cytochrome b